MFRSFKILRTNNSKQPKTSGNTSRYALYAFGEIFLVMVGILLALQVNNWNEERKERSIEKTYLEGLMEEFRQNADELSLTIELNENVRKSVREILQYTGPADPSVDRGQFVDLLGGVTIYNVEFAPNLSVISDLINSGHLNIISNDELRRFLADWNTSLANAKSQEEIVESYRNRVKDLIIREGNAINYLDEAGLTQVFGIEMGTVQFDTDNIHILQIEEFENLLGFRLTSSATLANRYQSLVDKITSILELIQEEL